MGMAAATAERTKGVSNPVVPGGRGATVIRNVVGRTGVSNRGFLTCGADPIVTPFSARPCVSLFLPSAPRRQASPSGEHPDAPIIGVRNPAVS